MKYPISPDTASGTIIIMIKVPGSERNGLHIRGSFFNPPTCMKSVILPLVCTSFKYMPMPYAPRQKYSPCPRLSIPVYPQIKSSPIATIANAIHFPRKSTVVLFTRSFIKRSGITASAMTINVKQILYPFFFNTFICLSSCLFVKCSASYCEKSLWLLLQKYYDYQKYNGFCNR